MPKTLELYFQDLNPEAQQRLVDFLGDNGNYDVFPIIVLKGEDEE